MDGWTGVKLNAPAIVMAGGGGGHKKGHNLVKILLIISNFELDLYFIILYYTEQK